MYFKFHALFLFYFKVISHGDKVYLPSKKDVPGFKTYWPLVLNIKKK